MPDLGSGGRPCRFESCYPHHFKRTQRHFDKCPPRQSEDIKEDDSVLHLHLKSQSHNILAVLFLTGMVFISEITRQPAVLFPEILALLTGMWIAPRMPWRVSRWEIPVLMTLCAVWGILVSRYCPGETAMKMGVAFVGAAGVLLISHTTLLPILSACILPILIGEQSWVYPIAVAVMTTLLAAGQTLLCGKEKPSAHWEWNPTQELIRWSILIPVVTVLSAFAIEADTPCVVAPPLLVLASELSFPESPVAHKSIRIAAVTLLCASVGALARWTVQIQLGLPLTLAAFLAAVLALTVFTLMKLPFPPAGALAILPMLLPEALIPTYPVQVTVGTVLFLSISWVIRTILHSRFFFQNMQKTC